MISRAKGKYYTSTQREMGNFQIFNINFTVGSDTEIQESNLVKSSHKISGILKYKTNYSKTSKKEDC